MGRRTISLDEMDKFEVDDDTNELYWGGRKIVTDIRLPWLVNAGIIATGVGTMALAVISFITYMGW